MNKCVITGEETNMLMKGKPVSRNGRQKVKDYLEKFRSSELPEFGFILTIKMAMDDLWQGRDIVDEFLAAKEKAEEEKNED